MILIKQNNKKIRKIFFFLLLIFILTLIFSLYIKATPIKTENIVWYISNGSFNAPINATTKTNYTMNGSFGPVLTRFTIIGNGDLIVNPTLGNDFVSFPNITMWDYNITSNLTINLYCNSTTNNPNRRTIMSGNFSIFNTITGKRILLGSTTSGNEGICPTGPMMGNVSTKIPGSIGKTVPYSNRFLVNINADIVSTPVTAGSSIEWGNSISKSNITFTLVPLNGFIINVTSYNKSGSNNIKINYGQSFLFVTNITCSGGRCGNTTVGILFNTTSNPGIWTLINTTNNINLTYAQNNPTYNCGNLSDNPESNENKTCSIVWNLTGVNIGSYGLIANASWTNSTDNTNYNSTLSIGNNQTTSLTVVESKMPIWIIDSVLKNESIITQNMHINLSSNWTDNYLIDSFIFSVDQGSGYKNSSSYRFGSPTGNVSSNVTFITAPAGTNVNWKFIVNDSYNNFNETGPDSFIVTSLDITNPLYYDKQKNKTLIKRNDIINFTANITDETSLDSFVFSIKLNSDSNFINSTPFKFEAGIKSANISNITKIQVVNNMISNVTWFFYFNDSYGNSNTTGLDSFVVDSLNPNYTDAKKNVTVVYNTYKVNFTANISDSSTLSGFIFSINLANNFINSSFMSLNSNVHSISNITQINAPEGTNVTWFFYFNDSYGNSNTTGLNSFRVFDNKTINWLSGSVVKNESIITQNMHINLSSNWTDNYLIDSFIFSVDQGSGYKNSSSYRFGSPTGNVSSNVTFITAPAGTNVNWKFIVNDSYNNFNETSPDSFIVTRQENIDGKNDAGSSYANTKFEIITNNNGTQIITENRTLFPTLPTNLEINNEFNFNLTVINAERIVSDMNEAGIPTKKSLILLNKLRTAYQDKDYNEVIKLASQIEELKNKGFIALDLIKNLESTKPNVLTGFVTQDFLNEDFDNVIKNGGKIENLRGISLFLEVINSSGLNIIILSDIMLFVIIGLFINKHLKNKKRSKIMKFKNKRSKNFSNKRNKH